MNKIEEIIDRITGLVSIVSYVGFFFIMMLIVIDVILRYMFSEPILGSYEIVERVVSCAVFASFAYAQTQKSHINISMLVDLFPIKAKMFCMFITGFLAACTAFFIAYAATRQARTALASNYTTAVLQISLYPFYWIEFLCMAVFGIVLLYDAIKCLLAIFNEDVLKSVV